MKQNFLFALALFSMPVAAYADPSQDTGLSDQVTAQQITSLQNEIAVLQDEAKISDLKAKIASPQGDTAPASPRYPGGPMVTVPPRLVARGAPDISDPNNRLPSVLLILGSGTRLTATLVLPSGAQITAFPGMALPGGLTVRDISVNGVEVMQAGNDIMLPFADSAPTSSVPSPFTSASAPGALMLPPPFPSPAQ